METEGDILDAADREKLDAWDRSTPGVKGQSRGVVLDTSLPPSRFATRGSTLRLGAAAFGMFLDYLEKQGVDVADRERAWRGRN